MNSPIRTTPASVPQTQYDAQRTDPSKKESNLEPTKGKQANHSIYRKSAHHIPHPPNPENPAKKGSDVEPPIGSQAEHGFDGKPTQRDARLRDPAKKELDLEPSIGSEAEHAIDGESAQRDARPRDPAKKELDSEPSIGSQAEHAIDGTPAQRDAQPQDPVKNELDLEPSIGSPTEHAIDENPAQRDAQPQAPEKKGSRREPPVSLQANDALHGTQVQPDVRLPVPAKKGLDIAPSNGSQADAIDQKPAQGDAQPPVPVKNRPGVAQPNGPQAHHAIFGMQTPRNPQLPASAKRRSDVKLPDGIQADAIDQNQAYRDPKQTDARKDHTNQDSSNGNQKNHSPQKLQQTWATYPHISLLKRPEDRNKFCMALTQLTDIAVTCVNRALMQPEWEHAYTDYETATKLNEQCSSLLNGQTAEKVAKYGERILTTATFLESVFKAVQTNRALFGGGPR